MRGCVFSCFSHAWLFATLWTVARHSSLSIRFFRQEYCSGLPCPPPGGLPDPEMESASPRSSALAGGTFTTRAIIYTEPNKLWYATDEMWSGITNGQMKTLECPLMSMKRVNGMEAINKCITWREIVLQTLISMSTTAPVSIQLHTGLLSLLHDSFNSFRFGSH